MGRRRHQATETLRQQVQTLTAYGVPQDEICLVVGVSLPTLHKHYRAELDTGAVRANARIAETIFKIATGGGPQAITAAMFWAKSRMGWGGHESGAEAEGKKARRQALAESAARRGRFATPPPPPRLAVDNG